MGIVPWYPSRMMIQIMSSLLAYPPLHAFLMNVARLGAWLLLLTVVFVPLEHWFALRPKRFFQRALLQDLGYYFLNGLVPGILLALAMSVVASVVHALVPVGMHAEVARLPLWVRALAGLIVGEVGFYWGHRWAHEIPYLWRFHAIHHSAGEVYFLTSARAHPVDNAFNRLCGVVPVYALGIATPLTPEGGKVAALLVLVMTLWGFFIHSNLRWRLGALEWVIATPAFHHWHHTLDAPRDRNFAPMLPVMDWLFGTLHLPRGAWPTAYGIDSSLPASLGGQMVYPLLPAAPRERAGQTRGESVSM